MRRLAFFIAIAGCGHTMTPQLKSCAEHIHIFRDGEKPNQPYQVVGFVRGKNDAEIAIAACRMGAHAIADVAYGEDISTRGTAATTGRIAVGRSRTSRRPFLQGAAITYQQPPDIQNR